MCGPSSLEKRGYPFEGRLYGWLNFGYHRSAASPRATQPSMTFPMFLRTSLPSLQTLYNILSAPTMTMVAEVDGP